MLVAAQAGGRRGEGRSALLAISRNVDHRVERGVVACEDVAADAAVQVVREAVLGVEGVVAVAAEEVVDTGGQTVVAPVEAAIGSAAAAADERMAAAPRLAPGTTTAQIPTTSPVMPSALVLLNSRFSLRLDAPRT